MAAAARRIDMADGDAAGRALLAAAADGDSRAFERVFRLYHNRVRAFARRLVAPDVADEVAADTFLTAWRRADSFSGTSRVESWLFGICYRVALNARRRGRRHQALPLEDSPVEPVPDHRFRVLLRHDVVRAMAALSVEHRAVITLTYVFGLRVREIAETLDCPEGTVKTRMFHARARLRAMLGEAL